MKLSFSVILATALLFAVAPAAPCALQIGFGEAEITPEVKDDKAVWLAGYGVGRRATGVHDPIMSRCVVLQDERDKIALVTVDLVGLQYPEVLRIRAELDDFKYVLVSSTHNHEGPDVIGIWGQSYLHRGVDDDYLKLVVERVVGLVRDTEKELASVTARYGMAEDESLLGDSRLPKVYDGVLRVLRFDNADGKQPVGILVQWNCHPEAMGSRNTLLTADFPHATVAVLKQRYECPVAYFSGTVGGLMAPPDGIVKDDDGTELKEGDFEYSRRYGEAVAKLAFKALDDSRPVELTPFAVAAKPIYLPVTNTYYRTARMLGVLRREALQWAGDADIKGQPLKLTDVDKTMAVETEVSYLRMGELHVAGIPGEIYPELVYGKYQEPADPAADFADAPLEKSVVEILPGKKWLLFGLANDEIGYIIPKRQWDAKAPFAYGRRKSQYGEINSCGPDVAPIIMRALEHRVAEAVGQ